MLSVSRSVPYTKAKNISVLPPNRNSHLYDEPFGLAAVYSHTEKLPPNKLNVTFFNILIKDKPLCFKSKSKTECFKITVKAQHRCINISLLLWQHISVLLDHLRGSIQRYEVHSVHIMYCGIPYCLQFLYTNTLKL